MPGYRPLLLGAATPTLVAAIEPEGVGGLSLNQLAIGASKGSELNGTTAAEAKAVQSPQDQAADALQLQQVKQPANHHQQPLPCAAPLPLQQARVQSPTSQGRPLLIQLSPQAVAQATAHQKFVAVLSPVAKATGSTDFGTATRAPPQPLAAAAAAAATNTQQQQLAERSQAKELELQGSPTAASEPGASTGGGEQQLKLADDPEPEPASLREEPEAGLQALRPAALATGLAAASPLTLVPAPGLPALHKARGVGCVDAACKAGVFSQVKKLLNPFANSLPQPAAAPPTAAEAAAAAPSEGGSIA